MYFFLTLFLPFIHSIIQMKYAALALGLSSNQSHSCQVEVLQGPNLKLLRLFLEEVPALDQDEIAAAAADRSVDQVSTPTMRSPASTNYDHAPNTPRPVVDVRTTGNNSASDREVILWNETFEFERVLTYPNTADNNAFEQEQRELDERDDLNFIKASGYLGQPLLSSADDAALLKISLDMLDADATILLRVVGPSSSEDDVEDGGRCIVGQALVLVDHIRKIAVPEGKALIAATHSLHSKTAGKNAGVIRVGLRFRLPHAFETGAHFTGKHGRYSAYKTEVLTDTLFDKYDVSGDGYLTRPEFLSFVRELHAVGGNIRQLEEADDGSRCLGTCIPLPSMDLVSFVKHNHTLLVVCFDRPDNMRKHVTSSLWGRLGFVAMSLIFSLSVNCLVTVYMASFTRFYQVITITIVDNIGKSLLNGVFIVLHLRCWSRAFRRCCGEETFQPIYTEESLTPGLAWGCCEILLLLVFIIFLGFFSTWLLLAMTSAQLISATSSFLPIWTFARVTEIFYWGTAWAFLVQYGASESAKRTRMRQREREKKRERERQRRARLLDPQQPWWRRGWNLIWPRNRETRHEEVI